MGFTVTRAGETRDKEFEAYMRLLSQHGADLGKLPRVPEPGTKRRWLPVWDTRTKAQAFADELKKRTGDPAWKVIPVNASPSEGPLGPLLIQRAHRGDRVIFALNTLSQALVRSAYPQAFGVRGIIIDIQRWDDFLKTQGNLVDLIRRIGPCLTGLSCEQLEALGYAVMDDDSRETLVAVPPGEAVQASEIPSLSPAAVAASGDGRSGGSNSQASR